MLSDLVLKAFDTNDFYITNSKVFNNRFRIYQDKDKYVIYVKIPGVKKSDVSVKLDNNLLTVSTKGTLYNTSLEESLSTYIPSYLNNDPIASLEDGILYLTFKSVKTDKYIPVK